MPGWGGEFEELIVKSFQRSTHVLWLVRYGPYVVFFFHFSRDGLRQKKGLFIAYTMYIRSLSCQCSSKLPVTCLFVCMFYFFLLFHSSPEYENRAKLYKSSETVNGVHKINPDGARLDFEVCDQKPAGGGWTVV